MFMNESNRMQHFLYAIIPAFLLTILFAAGLAIGMEFKDRMYGGKFDLLDIVATILGGIVGQALQAGLIILIIYLC